MIENLWAPPGGSGQKINLVLHVCSFQAEQLVILPKIMSHKILIILASDCDQMITLYH
jgi:hypothetical protein